MVIGAISVSPSASLVCFNSLIWIRANSNATVNEAGGRLANKHGQFAKTDRRRAGGRQFNDLVLPTILTVEVARFYIVNLTGIALKARQWRWRRRRRRHFNSPE